MGRKLELTPETPSTDVAIEIPPRGTLDDLDQWWAEQTTRKPTRFQVWSWVGGKARRLLHGGADQRAAIEFALRNRPSALFDNLGGPKNPALKVDEWGHITGDLKDTAALLFPDGAR